MDGQGDPHGAGGDDEEAGDRRGERGAQGRGAPVLARVPHGVVARRGRIQDRRRDQQNQGDARQRHGDVEVLPVGNGHGGERPTQGEDRLGEPRHVQARQRRPAEGQQEGCERDDGTDTPARPGQPPRDDGRRRQQGNGEGTDTVGHVPGGQGVAATSAALAAAAPRGRGRCHHASMVPHVHASRGRGRLRGSALPGTGHGVGPTSRRHGLGDEVRCGARPVWVDARRHGMRASVDWSYSCGARRTGMPRAPNSAATSGLRADRRIRFGVLCRTCAPTVARETSGGRCCVAARPPLASQ